MRAVPLSVPHENWHMGLDHQPVLGEVVRFEPLLLVRFVVGEFLHAYASAEMVEAVKSEVVLVKKAVFTAPQTSTYKGIGFVL